MLQIPAKLLKSHILGCGIKGLQSIRVQGSGFKVKGLDFDFQMQNASAVKCSARTVVGGQSSRGRPNSTCRLDAATCRRSVNEHISNCA
jgi:hypothetical protein